MDDAQASALQDFMSITGVGDPDAAIRVLEATNWLLEDAVNLQFATGGDLAGASGAAPGAASPRRAPAVEEDEVRAPLPVVRDRLYGDIPGPHGVPARSRHGAPPPDRGPTHIDVFRDSGLDPLAAAMPASGHSAPSAPAGAASSSGPAGNRLSDMFKPPAGLLFQGDFELAKQAAAKQARWLLVNVQSADEFATHRLNRDTWSQELVQDMLRNTFVFWQVYNTADQGQVLIQSYHLEQLPAVLIVDPLTGAKLWEKYGFITADSLLEELVSFMDIGPNDSGASALAQRHFEQSAKRRQKTAATSGSDDGGVGAAGGDTSMMTDDEQLALALAMSVEQQQPGAAGQPLAGQPGGVNANNDFDLDEDAIWKEIQRRQAAEQAAAAAAGSASAALTTAQQQFSAPPATGAAAPAAAAKAGLPGAATGSVDVSAVQAAAAARLPAEPGEGAAGSCRVAFRLPDGRRVQRRFNTTDTVAALQDYCISVSVEAASLSTFQLAEARPGAAPLAEPAETLQQTGVANAMLVIKTNS